MEVKSLGKLVDFKINSYLSLMRDSYGIERQVVNYDYSIQYKVDREFKNYSGTFTEWLTEHNLAYLESSGIRKLKKLVDPNLSKLYTSKSLATSQFPLYVLRTILKQIR